MAALVALQLLTNTSRRALDMHAVYQRRISPVKRMLDTEDNLMNFMLPFSLVNLTQDRKTRSRDEIRNKKCWEDGLQNWSESQFKKRLRVNRDTFHFLLGEIEDLITKETTRFKKPTSPECQLALTLYRMAHGSSFSTVGDLFGVAAPTACQMFSTVTSAIIARLYDRVVCLPRNEEEWTKELEYFLEDWEFPCVAAWDGFHVYISSNLKNFFSFKKRYSVTNMGLIGHNKRFLWAGVGAPGSMHDSTLLQSCPIFNAFEQGDVLPNKSLNLPECGEIPLVTVGDSAFPSRIWLMKAFPDTTEDPAEINFNKKLRSARVVSEHAYGMLKGRWRLLYKKVDCNKKNIKCVIMCAIALHNICIQMNDPCKRRWRLDVQELNLIGSRHRGVRDKNEVRRMRKKVVDWLWSLS